MSDVDAHNRVLLQAVKRAIALLDDDGLVEAPDEWQKRGFVSLMSREGYLNSEKAWNTLREAVEAVTGRPYDG